MEALLERLQRTAKESSVLEEAQQEWEASHPISAALILTPGTCRSSVWQWLIMFCTLLSIALIPVDIAFSLSLTNSGISTLVILLDSLFMLDMLCEFRTAFWNELLDVLVREPALIAKRYLGAGFFAVDLAGTIPFQIILVSTMLNDDWWAHSLKLISLLRIAKLFRLATKDPYITRAREQLGAAGQQLVLLIGGLVWFFHLLGCSYWLIVRKELESFSSKELALELDISDWLPPDTLISVALDYNQTSAVDPNITAEVHLDFSAYAFSFWWASECCGAPCTYLAHKTFVANPTATLPLFVLTLWPTWRTHSVRRDRRSGASAAPVNAVVTRI